MKEGQKETPRECEIERKKCSLDEVKFSSERVPQASMSAADSNAIIIE
jgi:hypothetical protein